MSKVGVAAFVMAMGLALPAAAQLTGPVAMPQGGPLNAAKDLYASARYDEALSVLNGLRIGDAVDRKAVEQYRSLCLLALGRATEAENAIAAVVKEDPTYRPGESEASPRVRATFTDVRKRLLPEITTARYQSAKSAYDRRDWAAAEAQFRIVLTLIDDPDNGGRLTDLRVLAAGFLELSARAAAPPPPPVEPKPTAPPAAAPPPVAPAGPIPGKIYTPDDENVTPPVVIRQDIPGIPQTMIAMARPRGLIDIVIDELGRVISMTMRTSIHPTYDVQVLSAARDWRYKPATLNGKPVRYRRLISINVQR
jgi:Gram-negative bacterial TonB protein C-terminal